MYNTEKLFNLLRDLEKTSDDKVSKSMIIELFEEVKEIVEGINYCEAKNVRGQIRKLYKHLLEYKYTDEQSIDLIYIIDDDMVDLQNYLYFDDGLREELNECFDAIDDISAIYERGVEDAARKIGINSDTIFENEEKSILLPRSIDELMDENIIYDFIVHYASSIEVKIELKRRGFYKED